MTSWPPSSGENMLKKEWRDIFLPVLLRLMIGPFLAVVYSGFSGKVNETSALLFFIGYAVSILWVALHMGLNAFHGEFHDKAFEYLLTFPNPRSQMLAMKFVLRVLVLGFLFSLYCLFWGLLKNVFLLPHPFFNAPLFSAGSFSFLILSYFVIGFFLSLVDWGSARPAIPLLILVGHALLSILLEKSFGYSANELSSILLIVATGFFFFFSFRKLRRGTLGHWLRNGSKRSLLLAVHPKNGRSWGMLRHELRIVARSFFFTALFIPVLGFLGSHVRITLSSGRQGPLDTIFLYAIIAFFLGVFFAFFSGFGLFYGEFRYKALEYLLTFPLSFRRILIDKLLARVLILVPVVIAYMIFVGHFSERLAMESGSLYIFLRPAFFPFWVALMLLNGFFLSLYEMKNMMALVSLANLYTIVFIPLAMARIMKRFAITAVPHTMNVLVVGSGLFLTSLILGIVFFKLRDRFDLAAPQRYSKVFGLFLFIIFTSVSLASLGIVIFI
jgi:hypothetical protein